VGFLDQAQNNAQRLTMMGGELCVNATLAAAYSQAQDTGVLMLSDGTNVQYEVRGELVSIRIRLAYQIVFGDVGCRVVVFDGIGYIVCQRTIRAKRRMLQQLCKKYSLPAAGIIEVQDNTIRPIVYVAATDSLVYETACGSGSIAYYLTTDRAKVGRSLHVRQPTGQNIFVQQKNPTQPEFTVTANINQIRNKNKPYGRTIYKN